MGAWRPALKHYGLWADPRTSLNSLAAYRKLHTSEIAGFNQLASAGPYRSPQMADLTERAERAAFDRLDKDMAELAAEHRRRAFFENVVRPLWELNQRIARLPADAWEEFKRDPLDGAAKFFTGVGDLFSNGGVSWLQRKLYGDWTERNQSGALYTLGQVAAVPVAVGLMFAGPGGALCGPLLLLMRGVGAGEAAYYGQSMVRNLWKGNYGAAAWDAVGVLGGLAQAFMRGACFAAGTPVLTPDGPKPIEELRPGDLVLSRSEHDPAGPVEAKPVEVCFATEAELLDLVIGGRTIRTTAEHPFYVEGRGWTMGGVWESHHLSGLVVQLVDVRGVVLGGEQVATRRRLTGSNVAAVVGPVRLPFVRLLRGTQSQRQQSPCVGHRSSNRERHSQQPQRGG